MNSRSHFNKKTGLLLLSAFIVVVTSGCDPLGPAYQSLDMDSMRLIPDLSVEKNLYGRDNGKTIDVVGSGTWASGKNTHPLSSQARIGDTTFPAPGTLDTNFNFAVYDASLQWRHFIANGPIGYEVAAGAGHASLHLGASSGTLQSAETITSPAFSLRIGLLARVSKTTSIEASTTGFHTKANLQDAGRQQVSVRQMLGHHIAIQGGYSHLHVNSSAGGQSNVEIRSSGPSLGVRFSF